MTSFPSQIHGMLISLRLKYRSHLENTGISVGWSISPSLPFRLHELSLKVYNCCVVYAIEHPDFHSEILQVSQNHDTNIRHSLNGS